MVDRPLVLPHFSETTLENITANCLPYIFISKPKWAPHPPPKKTVGKTDSGVDKGEGKNSITLVARGQKAIDSLTACLWHATIYYVFFCIWNLQCIKVVQREEFD